MSFLNHLISGISLGSIYAIIALGYTMVYGIAKMLNFAHGDVIMVGGYMCFCATTYLGWPAWMGVVLAVIVCTALGVVIERLAYKPLRMAPSLAVLITAIGVSYFLQNAALLIWSSNPKTFTSVVTGEALSLFGGQMQISKVTLVAIAACVVIMVALMLFTGKSKVGTAMRAVSEDKGAAQLMGINVNTTISITFAIGSGRGRAAVLRVPDPDADHRLSAGHQGIHRCRIRRHRLDSGRVHRRHSARHHRDFRQGVHFHAAVGRDRVRSAHRGAAGQAGRPARQACERKGLRGQSYEQVKILCCVQART